MKRATLRGRIHLHDHSGSVPILFSDTCLANSFMGHCRHSFDGYLKVVFAALPLHQSHLFSHTSLNNTFIGHRSKNELINLVQVRNCLYYYWLIISHIYFQTPALLIRTLVTTVTHEWISLADVWELMSAVHCLLNLSQTVFGSLRCLWFGRKPETTFWMEPSVP